jgi:glycosyltransferase involved in cell wall biosynthesis
MPELVRDGENGFFIERDVGQLTEKLRWLADDAVLRREMGKNARRSVESWDWGSQARHYADLFAQVLAGEWPQTDSRQEAAG